jgi:peptide/nickel transport system permease protein
MRYVVNKLLQFILLITGVLILVFFMVRLTGDPVSLMVARDATTAQREAFREAMGFNRPLAEQLTDYLAGVLRGDLGNSLSYNLPAIQLILQRLPATLELAVASLMLAIAVGIPIGILAGMNPNSRLDWFSRLVGLTGQIIPSFWLAMILILIFAVNLRMFPSFGRSGLSSLILPAFALAIDGIGQLTRLTRSVVLEIRVAQYVRTAQAKGIHPIYIGLRHVLPNAAIPLISVIGIQFTYLLGGAVYIESVFAWPGLGLLLENAITNSDFPLVQAITIFIAFFAITINLLTDLLYTWLDPRVRI